MLRIENMLTAGGNPSANQSIIYTNIGRYFKSYNTIIAFIPLQGKTLISKDYKCSVTTGKYRNKFLGMNLNVLERHIQRNIFTIVDKIDVRYK